MPVTTLTVSDTLAQTKDKTMKIVDWPKIKIANKTGRVAILSKGRVYYARCRND